MMNSMRIGGVAHSSPPLPRVDDEDSSDDSDIDVYRSTAPSHVVPAGPVPRESKRSLVSADGTATASGSCYLRFGKRTFDLVLSVTLILLCVPTMLAIALAIRFTMGPHVLFRQVRVGRNGENFTMYKFRTMLNSRRVSGGSFDGVDRRRTHKHPDDPRHTKLGKLLRKTSLDELPQFANVLLGQMSFVGPRPELSTVVDKYGLRDHPRHMLSPGITGQWQITSRNEGVLLHECFDHDLPYLHAVSAREDARILLRTVGVLLSPRGR